MQHEITRSIPLLDASGNLTEPGYARQPLPVYDRRKVKAPAVRLQERDSYYVGNERFGLVVSVADCGYTSVDTVSFVKFGEKPWQITKTPVSVLPARRTVMPASAQDGATVSSGRHHALCFLVKDGKRSLTAHVDSFRGESDLDAQIVLTEEPEESMVLCTPLGKPGRFLLTRKINCMRAEGFVTIGDYRFRFDPAESYGVLEWSRGAGTAGRTRYWGSASGELDGVPFGFNLGYGLGSDIAATENMILYGGRMHKLSGVMFRIPRKDGREDYMAPWTFTSDDGRFEMDFVPVFDRSVSTDAPPFKAVQHQVFGRFTGKAVLDDGRELEVRDLFGFAEKETERW